MKYVLGSTCISSLKFHKLYMMVNIEIMSIFQMRTLKTVKK